MRAATGRTIPTGPATRRGRPPSIELDVLVAAGPRLRRRHRRRSGRAVDIDIAMIPSWRLRSSSWRARGSATRRRCASAGRRSGCWSTGRLRPFTGIKRHPLEVLCLGQQFVALCRSIPTPAGPTSGRRRAWLTSTSASLPAIDEAAARAFLDEALALLPEHLQPTRLGAAPAAAGVVRRMRRQARSPRSARRSPASRTPISTTTAGCASAWR